ncbi:MAG: MarR family transcriptional regulator [Thermoleophilia bacterium]|nr:MarR family transcriptional regulator [Thermoleophilia bacterium]
MPDVSRAAGRIADRSGGRDLREIIRDEHLMRRRILEALADGPLTIPQIAEAVGRPSHEVVLWVMGMRKYGHLTEIKEADDEGFYLYQAVEKEGG